MIQSKLIKMLLNTISEMLSNASVTTGPFLRNVSRGYLDLFELVSMGSIELLKMTNMTVWVMIGLFIIYWIITLTLNDTKIEVKGFVLGQERERFEIIRDIMLESNKELRNLRAELRVLRKKKADEEVEIVE